MTPPARILVLAMAPVAGQVKTRLGRDIGMDQAARLAAAALLDTLGACTLAFGADHCHLALDGDLSTAVDGDLIRRTLAGWSVTRQRGDTFAVRLVNAHGDLAAAAPGPVVQIGMDTPQVTPQLLASVVDELGDDEAPRADAVLGPAEDGGWWVLALRDAAHAAPLARVAMSTPTTYVDTRHALASSRLQVSSTATLRDVDTVADAIAVANDAPHTHFARSWAAVTRENSPASLRLRAGRSRHVD